MANWHLEELRNILERNSWKILSELEGNDYDTSAVWQISRPSGSDIRYLQFNGFNDMDCLPLSQAYAVGLWKDYYPHKQLSRDKSSNLNASLYFSKKGKKWQNELEEFIEKVNLSA